MRWARQCGGWVPLVPIFFGHVVGVAALSYDSEVTFGLNADCATVPDLDVLKGEIDHARIGLGSKARRSS